ncbi:hypothetical protein [uncultured Paracoccus sp.]|uniref:hypothetical protein n=1 Tax=uncultured Paracoccus sp. TaxID=189685 RepID=UPI0026375C58|nr:hypothetical protein [uncultured Paracoccus sp.]
MSGNQYVIVGSEVDQAAFYLHGDGSIDDQKGGDGQPLNVEFIGKLMVRLSKLGPGGLPPAELDKLEDQVRHALMVQDFSVQSGGAALSDDERAAILDNTDVRIEFERRKRRQKKPDRNTRILVVPSDQTLEITDKQLQDQGSSDGFRPPLSYELDRALMLASMKDEILQMTREFAAKAEPGWTQALQDALETHMAETLKARGVFNDGGGGAADDVKNEIMKSPLRAFYRSVGIYATNMCR